jgi:hypothetical protein
MLRALAAPKWKAAGVVLLLVGLALGGGMVAYHALPSQPDMPEQLPERASKPDKPEQGPAPAPRVPEAGKAVPDPEKYGTRAGARNFAKSYFRATPFSANFGPTARFNADDGGPIPWPSRAFEVTFDPETHLWTVTGSGRVDSDWLGGSGQSWEWDWKLALSYNPSTRGYKVQKAEWPALNKPGTVRPARMDDYGKWLQGRFTKPGRSADPVTALQLVLEGLERTRFGREPKYSYGKDKLVLEPSSRGVNVRIGDPVGWAFRIEASRAHSLNVGEYGGAGPGRHGDAGPQLLGGGGGAFWSEGEFVVREIELQDNKITRLAIDFIMDSEYGLPSADKRDSRHILRGSLRFNSRFEPSIPELDRDAAE